MLPALITDIPGPKSRELAETLGQYESQNVTYLDAEFPIFWERASGTNIWDVDGNRFLDTTSAFGVAGLGHTNDVAKAALQRQSERLLHAMGDVHPPALKAELCRKLSAITFERWKAGTGKTILGNSGFEAVEAALKTSVLYSGKPGIIAFEGAYHGLGYGALGVGGLPYFQSPFRKQLADFATILPYPHCYRCPFQVEEAFRVEGDPFPNCSAECLTKIHDEIRRTLKKQEIGAILVEPCQGRGGEIVPPRDFLKMLRQICDEEKILLIADEIYTGLNRTGALFACDHFRVVPDIICLGKALTGGFPLSACVGRSDIMDAWPKSQGEALHTSTFLGNPMGCAMAIAALDEHAKPETAAQVKERGRRMKQQLATLQSPYLGNIRGVGLMIGLELVTKTAQSNAKLGVAMVKQGLKDGIILLSGSPEGNVLSFAPVFSISDEEIDFLVKKLQEYLTSLPGSIS